MDVLLPQDLKGMIALSVYLFVAFFGTSGLAYFIYRLDHPATAANEGGNQEASGHH